MRARLVLALLACCSPDEAAAPVDVAPPPAEAPPPVAAPPKNDDAPACTPTAPRAAPIELSVLPDAGEKPFADLLASATKSIRVFCYEMGSGAVRSALVAKAAAGVDVRVVFDGNTERDRNTADKSALEAAGAKCAWSDPAFSYMHAKTIVVDDRAAIVSTGNYSRHFIVSSRDYVAKDVDPADVADLGALFDADWTKTAPDLSCTRLLVSPINAEQRLVDLVNGATKSILVESMQWDNRAVRDAVLAKKHAGLDVRIVLADPTWVDANGAAGKDLAAQGVAARWLASPGVHVKSIIVDGARAYLGSENLSYTSLRKNREIGLVVSDAPAVTAMQATFEADFAAATPF